MIALLSGSQLFSQIQVVNKKDTLICFTTNQSKIILKELERLSYLDSLSNIQSEEIAEYQLKIQNLNETNQLKSIQINLGNDLRALKDFEVKNCMQQKKASEKAFNRQKLQKNIFILSGTLFLATSSYLLISK